MRFSSFLLFVPVVCALAQTPPIPNPNKSGPAPSMEMKIVQPPDGAPPPPTDPNKVVLTIGDEKITAARFQELVNTLPEQYRGAAMGSGRTQFAENVARVYLMANEARKAKFDKTPEWSFQLESVLANTYFNSLSKNVKVGDAEVAKYYNENKAEYEQVRARHILIRFKTSPVPIRPGQQDISKEEALAKAQQIRKRLLAGEDFATLAKAESDDTGSGANGGDLGFFRHGQMVPQFDQAAFSLPVLQVSDPIETPYGYHLIKVEERQAKSIDEVRSQIEQKIRPKIAAEEVEKLRKNSKVELDPAYFANTQPALYDKPAVATPAPAPAAPPKPAPPK